jgi:acetylglutamate kinase
MSGSPILVVKIGGSTLGSHDTTMEDLVALHGGAWRPLVVHGGGAAISEWLKVHDTPTRFVRGLRVTDAASLRVVVAVLAGLINKELVTAINALGGRAIGLSGADGGLIHVSVLDPELGYVGQIERVDGDMLMGLLDEGYLPVVAPLGLLWQDERPRDQIMNINADTVAGEVALALGARWLVFLTDVPGIAGGDGRSLARLSPGEAAALVEEGVVSGGMIPRSRPACGPRRADAHCNHRRPPASRPGGGAGTGELAGTIIGPEEAQ